ncbi:MAG: HAMP domain-containing sensor histidine kinase [bacterium]
MRRFEKNYFLYGKKEADYRENLRFVNRAKGLVAENREVFKGFEAIVSVPEIEKALNEYKGLMAKDFLGPEEADSHNVIILEAKIRAKGKEIVTITEEISKVERRHIRKLLLSSQRTLIASISAFILFSVIFGYILLRMVTKPLKLLENSMERIAGGGFDRVSINSSDREITSLRDAINRMLRELEWRQRRLVQSEKLVSLGTLVSGMAHELNNPLSNISTSCQILQEEMEEANIGYKKKLLSQIGEQTDRARDIVRSILEFSRAKELKKERLFLKDLIDETILFVRGEVPAGVEITVDVPDEIEIYADKPRMQQAFLNLIKNAIEAVPLEGMVSISASRITGEEAMDIPSERAVKGDAVEIKIRDTGPGINPDILPRIFDPFFTTKDVGKGFGLGLFITHGIIEEHGGSIKVTSRPGQGAAFLIQLPQEEGPGKGVLTDE